MYTAPYDVCLPPDNIGPVVDFGGNSLFDFVTAKIMAESVTLLLKSQNLDELSCNAVIVKEGYDTVAALKTLKGKQAHELKDMFNLQNMGCAAKLFLAIQACTQPQAYDDSVERPERAAEQPVIEQAEDEFFSQPNDHELSDLGIECDEQPIATLSADKKPTSSLLKVCV